VWISDSINIFGKFLCQNESVGTVNREAECVYVQFFMFIRGNGYNSSSSMNVVNTSKGPNRGCRWRSVWVSLHDFFNNSQFWVFQNPRRTIRFHERTSKLLSSLWFEFKIFCWLGRGQGQAPQKFYLLGWGRGKCFKFWPLPVIYAYISCLTLQWVFDPKSKNRPTLVESGNFL